MSRPNWRAYGVGLGLVCGAGIGIIGSLLFSIQLVYGIAVGSMIGYVTGLIISLTGKS